MAESYPIILVDDDAEVLYAYGRALELEGFVVKSVGNGSAALASLTPAFAGAVLTDVKMPGIDGLNLLERIKVIDPEIPVLLFTGHAEIEMAVGAVRSGAYDFIEKPADPVRLVDALTRACSHRRLVLENRELRSIVTSGDQIEAKIIGRTPIMHRMRSAIIATAETNADVLVYGDTGTGKELVARCLHDFSARCSKPFVPINCGALPESMIEGELFGHEVGAFTGATGKRIGKFEYASGGTLFLDEIESMPMGAQVRLLRVLQERSISRLGSNKEIPVDLRVVAATKVDLKLQASKGLFREDLYYRLNVATIRIPSLKERRSDVALLFAHFLESASKRNGRPSVALSQSLIDPLALHDWPGNVRELRNAAERVALGLGDAVPQPGLDRQTEEEVEVSSTLAERLDRAECQIIEAALSRCSGRIARTAAELGLTRKTLYLKMRRHNLDKDAYRDAAFAETEKDVTGGDD